MSELYEAAVSKNNIAQWFYAAINVNVYNYSYCQTLFFILCILLKLLPIPLLCPDVLKILTSTVDYTFHNLICTYEVDAVVTLSTKTLFFLAYRLHRW